MQTAQISTKGQIVIPKAIRDKHAFVDGQTIEVIDTPAGVLLRLPLEAKRESAEAVMARIHARNTYHGPRVSAEEMNAAIDAMFRNHATDDDW